MSNTPAAMVTGAARGIGAAIAVQLAREGFDVAAFDITDSADTVAAIEKAGRKGLSITGDVTRAEDRAAALAAVEKAFGRLDALVNNAGVAPNVRADLLEAGEESYDRVMNINLKGPYFLTQAVANWMVRRRGEGAGEARPRRSRAGSTLGTAQDRKARHEAGFPASADGRLRRGSSGPAP